MGDQRHNLTDFDAASQTANCSICGPGSSVYVRPSARGMLCRAKVAEGVRRSSDLRRIRGRAKRVPGVYDDLFLAQNGRCAICSASCPTGRALAIDHDHSCCDRGCRDCVRGLLCQKCNCGLGLLGDTAENVRRALEYLERTNL